jgi:hypothetical protein
MSESYIDNLISINKNLRDQIETLHKLLKMKLRTEYRDSKLVLYIEEMEILKTSLSLNLEKYTKTISNLVDNW